MKRTPYRLRRKDLQSFAVLRALPFIITDHEPDGWKKRDELVLERFESIAAQHRHFSDRLRAWLEHGRRVGLAIIGIGPEKIFVGVFERERPRRKR
jgi:hypothetical protein